MNMTTLKKYMMATAVTAVLLGVFFLYGLMCNSYALSKSDYRAVAVDMGATTYAAILDDGSLWTWGGNWIGVGDGTTDRHSEPVKIMDDVSKVSCDGENFAAVKTDGSLWTCGYNNQGQIGDGTTTDRLSPVKVLDNVVDVSCSGHVAAIKNDGSLWIWGLNNHGQVGNNSTTNQLMPVKIMDNVSKVSCGYESTLVVKKDGSLWKWGLCNEEMHEEGDGWSTKWYEGVDYLTPQYVMNDALSISCFGHKSVIKTDNTLWLWDSYNDEGQIGIGTIDRYGCCVTPQMIMSSVREASMGYLSSSALTTDGNLWVWGDNAYHQLGDGTTNDSLAPKLLMSDVMHVSMGRECGAAIKNDGSVWIWGSVSPFSDQISVPKRIYFGENKESPSDPSKEEQTHKPANNKLFGVTLTKLSKGKKSFTAKWKKASKKQQKQFSGYQIQYSTSPDFSGWVKTKGTTKKSASKVVIRKLKKKTTYYVRMRRYKKSGGGTIYSDWSKVKSVRTK